MEDSMLAAASAALGSSLTDPVRLAGSNRAVVLRCRVVPDRTVPDRAARDRTVVVKAYRREPNVWQSFANEAAALAFGVVGPRLLAVDRQVPLVVMTDLGAVPSLADRLLGSSAEAAREGLLRWASDLGKLAASTRGREAELAAWQAKFGHGRPGSSEPGWHRKLPELASRLGVEPPAGLDADVAAVLAAIAPQRYPVFSPGDACPDNTLITEDGLQMIDFEAAGYHCLFTDAAYIRMPFATCWCVFRLPEALVEQVEAAYRREVSVSYPELAHDTVWRSGVRHAEAAWTVAMSAWMVPATRDGDEPMHRTRRPVASRRQLLRYRWQHAAGELTSAGELPALTSLLRRFERATDHWAVPALPLYPAFNGTS